MKKVKIMTLGGKFRSPLLWCARTKAKMTSRKEEKEKKDAGEKVRKEEISMHEGRLDKAV